MLRCQVCRSRRATFTSLVAHQRASGHGGPCLCGGYHHPHRPGSSTCESHPYVRANSARRAGASDDDVLDALIDDILDNDHKPVANPERIPF